MNNPTILALLAAVAGGAMLGLASAASPITVTAVPDSGRGAAVGLWMADRGPRHSRGGHLATLASDAAIATGRGEFGGWTPQPLWGRSVAGDDRFGACSVFEDTFCPGFGGIKSIERMSIERMWACAADSSNSNAVTSCALIGGGDGDSSAENSPTNMGAIAGAPYLFFYPGNGIDHEAFASDSVLTGVGIMSVPEPASLGLLGLGLLGLGAARRRSA